MSSQKDAKNVEQVILHGATVAGDAAQGLADGVLKAVKISQERKLASVSREREAQTQVLGRGLASGGDTTKLASASRNGLERSAENIEKAEAPALELRNKNTKTLGQFHNVHGNTTNLGDASKPGLEKSAAKVEQEIKPIVKLNNDNRMGIAKDARAKLESAKQQAQQVENKSTEQQDQAATNKTPRPRMR